MADADRALADALAVGSAYETAGRPREAQRIYADAARARPDAAEPLRRLAGVTWRAGYVAAAIPVLRRALRLDPTSASCLLDLADACATARRFSEAVACYRQASALRPGDVGLLRRLGGALLDAGRRAEAIECLEEVAGMAPAQTASHLELAYVRYLDGDLDAAVASYQRAIALDPRSADAHNNLGHVLKDLGRVGDAVQAFRRAAELAPERAAIHSNLLYTLWYDPGVTEADVFAEHRRWAERHADGLRRPAQMYRQDRDPHRRLRVGYVSPDFRQHPLGALIEPVLAGHDRRAVEVVCYADVARPDVATARIRASADVWRPVAGLSDARLEHAIRQDRIDVLVDLTVHMAGNRLPLFARKPAPVQATYLGYPATTGMRAMDYRITDERLDPDDATVAYRTERLARIDGSYWCYAPLADGPPATRVSGHDGHVTFGCLNNFCKINPDLLRLWARILDAVPDARLAVLVNGRSASYPGLFAAHGIEPARVVLLDRAPRPVYLAYYQRIDVGLDPFPCGGHTTTLDALWMGVPVVTLAGRTAMGRAAASVVSRIALGDLVATSEDDYVAIAVALACDRDRRRALRTSLPTRMRDAGLLDAADLARRLEAAYRAMWREWCAGP